MKNELMVINENNTIVESTKMIREAFNYNVSKPQMNFIYSIISLVRFDDDEFTEYQIPFKEFGKLIDKTHPTSKRTMEVIDNETDKIMSSFFKISDKEGRIRKYHWVKDCMLDPNTKMISFKLDNEVKEFYLHLKTGECTYYLLKDLLSLKTVFQANLFRWLSCNSNFPNAIRIPIDKAKQTFYGENISNGELVRKINEALSTINSKTNIYAEFTKIKKAHGELEALDFKITNNYKKENNEFQCVTKKQNDNKRSKAMWQENLELKRENGKLVNKIDELNQENQKLRSTRPESLNNADLIDEEIARLCKLEELRNRLGIKGGNTND